MVAALLSPAGSRKEDLRLGQREEIEGREGTQESQGVAPSHLSGCRTEGEPVSVEDEKELK